MRSHPACALLAALALTACATPEPFRDPFESFSKGSPSAPSRIVVSDADNPVYQLKPDENNFALVVGVQTYASLPEAEYAQRDAVAVKNHLLALGYPERNIILLTNKDASRASLEKYLESWFPRNLSEQSRLFVFFSGHGAPAAKDGQAYLVPWDGDPQFLETTAYSLKEFYRKLDDLKTKEVLVVMDSCFSGAGGRSVIAKGTRPLVAKVDIVPQAMEKLLVLAASGGDEVTGVDETQGHGLFTYYFLKALNERKGEATLQQLFDSLTPKVKDAARRQNRDQTPQLMSEDPAMMSRMRLAR